MGRIYDRFGLPAVLVGVVLSSLFAPLALIADKLPLVIVAMPLLGIG